MPEIVVTVEDVNKLLNINLWQVRSFRADIALDFDEYGNILNVEILNKDEV